MSEKPAASGSIWNVNSWHWEMKNYTVVAKKLVEEKFLSMQLKDGDVVVTTTKVRFPQAEAEVNIRKGKQYLVYEFEVDVDFRAENDADEVNGSYKAREINGDDLDDIVIEDVRVNDKNDISEKVKTYLKKNLKQEITNIFKNFMEDLARIQSDPAKLEQDKKRREQAQIATQKARKEKGEQKERLLQQQRQKQKKMKEEFSKWSVQHKAN